MLRRKGRNSLEHNFLLSFHTASASATGSAKKVDVDVVPQVGGQSLLDVDLDAADKPWRLPGQLRRAK